MSVDVRKKGAWHRPIIERFLERVEITSTCWNWKGAVNANGYGCMWDGTKPETVTRLAYRLLIGDFDSSLFVLHRCDRPICVKPSHLFLGTHQDNMRDRDAKGRAARGCGENNPMAQLSEIQARAIKLSNEPLADLSARFGVSLTVISNIRNGKTWKHI